MQIALNKLKKIIISITDNFSPDLESLRVKGFGERYGKNLLDKADPHSFHIVVHHEKEIIATVRITPRAHSILDQWTIGGFPYSNNSSAAELTRGVVDNSYQALGLYKLVMSKALISCPLLGFNTVICAARIDLPQLPFLYKLGFSDLAKTVDCISNSRIMKLQPLILNVDNNLEKIIKLYQETLKTLKMKNFEVIEKF